MREPWLDISFPERLFVMGAGPSLEILYEYRHEANDWGDWVVTRSDLVQPLLKFIEPKYTIRYYSAIRNINKTYGIPLEKVHPDTKAGQSGGSSIHEFIYQFQDHGGKELFLFGFDGTNTGYWRRRGSVAGSPIEAHQRDCDHMNNCSSQISIKLFHIGETRHKLMKQISIDDLKGTYLNA